MVINVKKMSREIADNFSTPHKIRKNLRDSTNLFSQFNINEFKKLLSYCHKGKKKTDTALIFFLS